MPSEPRTLTAVPVFPLPEYYLFPGVVAPLHVFETRYRQMMQDLMDGPGRLVLVPYHADGPRDAQGPALPHLGTLAEIVQHEHLEDGRWVLIVAALGRVSLTEVPSDRLYRKVDADLHPDIDPGPAATAALRPRLVSALQERADGEWSASEGVAVGRLADLLLHALELDDDRKERAYMDLDPVSRAALALAWHELAQRGEDADRAQG